MNAVVEERQGIAARAAGCFKNAAVGCLHGRAVVGESPPRAFEGFSKELVSKLPPASLAMKAPFHDCPPSRSCSDEGGDMAVNGTYTSTVSPSGPDGQMIVGGSAGAVTVSYAGTSCTVNQAASSGAALSFSYATGGK